MSKKLGLLLFLLTFVTAVYASSAAKPAAGEQKPVLKTEQAAAHSVNYFALTVVFSAVGLGIAAAVCGIGQGMAVSKAVEGIARQPEATSQIQTAMIIGLSFIESLVIYVLLISLILLFVNPFMKYFIQ
jgi:F-type H+-transporting ATPase subunit c